MAKTEVSYSQFEQALRSLGFTKKLTAPEGIILRHTETDFPVVLPSGGAEDIVPGMYYEVARRTIELRGIATRRQFEQAMSRATKSPRRVIKRPRPIASAMQ